MNKTYHHFKGWYKTYTILEEKSKDIIFQASTKGPTIEIHTSIKQLQGKQSQVLELCRELSEFSLRGAKIKINWDQHIRPILNNETVSTKFKNR
jgi:hypothetical protein